MSKHQIIAERGISKRQGDDVIREQVNRCASLALKGSRGQGWTYRIAKIEQPEARQGVLYRATVNFDTTSNRESLLEKWPRIVKRFAEAGCAGNLRTHPWIVRSPEGYQEIAAAAHEEQIRSDRIKAAADEPKELGTVNLEPGDNFARIYGRDAQIRRIMDALHLGQRTNWVKRKNSLLDGPPGCGKSEIMLGMRAMLGEEGKAWRWFDATTMTKAGAVEEIMESRIVPPVLFIEEIEKCEEAALRWLLGVMDTRGEIRRLNYKVGNQARNVRMVVIASANNVKLLKTVMSGALYSRFQNKIFCPEPDREIMRRILMREVVEIDGDEKWVEPALEFAYDKWCITDPRDVINIMSCGGKRLLNGEAQKDYETTMHPLERRLLLRKKKKRESKQEAVAV